MTGEVRSDKLDEARDSPQNHRDTSGPDPLEGPINFCIPIPPVVRCKEALLIPTKDKSSPIRLPEISRTSKSKFCRVYASPTILRHVHGGTAWFRRIKASVHRKSPSRRGKPNRKELRLAYIAYEVSVKKAPQIAGVFVNASIETVQPRESWLRRFFVREDAVYAAYESAYQAKTTSTKVLCLFLYLLPGIVAAICINSGPLFRAQMAFTGLSARYLQYAWVLFITFGWHMFVPFLALKYVDKLSWRETLAFLGLNRVDQRGLFLVLPVYFVLFALLSLPYLKFVAPLIVSWTKAVPLFRIPSYSIFQETPEAMYGFPTIALLFLAVGNFFGEEIYFRGYLMKKSAFLGRLNWIVNSLLFALYHLWQVQQTWPMIGLVLAFGLLMALRKDLYVLITFHFLANMWMAYGTG